MHVCLSDVENVRRIHSKTYIRARKVEKSSWIIVIRTNPTACATMNLISEKKILQVPHQSVEHLQTK